MNRPYLIVLASTAVVALGAITYAAIDYTPLQPPVGTASTTTEAVVVRDYGEATLALGETAVFEGLTVTPLQVVEDSRCPIDVQCIQAGTVRVQVEIVSGMGTSTDTIALGSHVTTEAQRITLTDVSPGRRSTADIASGDYRITLKVEKREVSMSPQAPGSCYVGGCSMQLCSDRPDMVSTCEYRESYACYKGATCERQANGACGWTETKELKTCLLEAQ